MGVALASSASGTLPSGRHVPRTVTKLKYKDPALRERNVKVSGLSKVIGGLKRMADVVRSEGDLPVIISNLLL